MQKKEKITIFIDLDGTILDVTERVYRIYRDILKKYKKKYLPKKIYLKLRKENLPIKEILKKTKAGNIYINFKKESEKKIEDYRYLILDKLPRARKRILFRLKERYKLILVTFRKDSQKLTRQLKQKKINKIFDAILVYPSKTYRQKWKLKYRLIKNQRDFDKNSIIVGDTKTDIIAGKKLGIKTIGVLWGMSKKESLEKYKPNFLITDFSKLENAILKSQIKK